MSYARLSKESDVYVFASEHGVLHCHWCALGGDDATCYSVRKMLMHLRSHRRAGHKVPQICIAWILLDALSLDRPALWIRRQWMTISKALTRGKS